VYSLAENKERRTLGGTQARIPLSDKIFQKRLLVIWCAQCCGPKKISEKEAYEVCQELVVGTCRGKGCTPQEIEGFFIYFDSRLKRIWAKDAVFSFLLRWSSQYQFRYLSGWCCGNRECYLDFKGEKRLACSSKPTAPLSYNPILSIELPSSRCKHRHLQSRVEWFGFWYPEEGIVRLDRKIRK